MKQCSALFADVFDSHCGGLLRTCACGITTFNCVDRGDFELGELEDLEAREKADPEHYHAVDHTVSTMTFCGQEIVFGCTCDKARQAERFIRVHARQLAEYLRRYADALRKRTDDVDVKNLEVNP